jgi:hypothetical protein
MPPVVPIAPPKSRITTAVATPKATERAPGLKRVAALFRATFDGCCVMDSSLSAS